MKNARLFLLSFFLLIGVCGFAQDPQKWEPDVIRFEKSDALAPEKKGMILFVGSSSIARWSDIQSYFPSYQILNRGFGGSQFSDLIYYVPRVVVPYKPSKIFIYEGDNDIAAGEDPDRVLEEAVKLREMISKELPAVPVVFISPKPSIARWHLKEKYETFNRELKRYAAKTKLTMYADVWSAMLDKNGNVYPVFVRDNLHMTADGYKIWQQVISKYLPASVTD